MNQFENIIGNAVPGPLLTIKSGLHNATMKKLYISAMTVVKILVK